MKKYFAVLTSLSLMVVASQLLYADAGVPEAKKEAQASPQAQSANSEPGASSALGQFPNAEIAPIAQGPGAAGAVALNFPKVKTQADAELAKKFSWWPTDAHPAPVKDSNRSGYWWWPAVPGQARPWGNRGYVYVTKIIFDYKTSEGESKPSLIVKRIIKNVKVYFDYDKSDLRGDAVDALSKAQYTLEHNPKADILITGNADVRGSEHYNEKLGERRALAVRQYVIDKGLPENRIRILSRGKLDALAPTNDIVGMQKDRNAQFVIAEVEEVMIPAAQAGLYQDKVIEEKKVFEGAIKVSTKDYVIQKGDTLWRIAQNEYGDGKQWKRIYEFNKEAISNPDRPRKGTKIKIPIENNLQ